MILEPSIAKIEPYPGASIVQHKREGPLQQRSVVKLLNGIRTHSQRKREEKMKKRRKKEKKK